ncbi:MAG: bifunctional oligoribonuclease/PAP phosphatase NrnA [Syntrophomonadaceae bacterium]|nr:bifunctional oligoribonuclease/PAP phosphatase NrnA [Syntrophomonadaceae bacterium]
MKQPDAIASFIKDENGFIIVGHINPDGDCIGSVLGLGRGLMRLGKDVRMVLTDAVPEVYRYLAGSEDIESAAGFCCAYTNVIYLDCAEQQRCGDELAAQLRQQACHTVCIDHHISNLGFAEFNWVDPQATATAELVYELLKKLDATFAPDITDPLCVGILQDTGFFHHSNAGADTLRLAAELMDNGANLHETYLRLYESMSVAEMMLHSRAIGSLKLSPDQRVAWMQITAADLKELDAEKIFPEDLVSKGLAVRSVEVGLLFREVAADKIKVSLRAKHDTDVAMVAESFGGGGHRKAAGVTMQGSLDACIEQVLAKLREVMEA